MRTAGAIIASCFLLLCLVTSALAQPPTFYEDEEIPVDQDPSIVINRPPNVQGLTGLILCNSAYTQPQGRVVLGLASIAQNSNVPNFSIIQGIATVTAGVTEWLEVGLRGQYIGTNLGSSATREFGIGDTDLLVKARLWSQGDTLPAVALGLGYTLPTGDKEQGLRSVEDQAIRLMLIGTSEQEMPGDYFIGVYFEGQVVHVDRLPWEDEKTLSEKYGVVNAGLLLPLNESRSLQVMLEYSTVVKKNMPDVYEQNHSALMPGLRFVTDRLNVSLGVQFYNPKEPGMSDDLRYLGTLSYAF